MPRIVALADRLLRVDQRATAASNLRTSRLRGVRRAHLIGWLFVAPALLMYAAFVLLPLALTVQFSLYRWDGIGPSEWVGLRNYVSVLTDPDLVGVILNAFKLIVFFSFVPVGLGLIVASVMRRIATGPLRHRIPDGALPSAGHPARGRRYRLEVGPLTSGVVNQVLSAIGLGDVTRPGLATSTRHSRRRDHRCLGPDRPVHDLAAHRHEQDRHRALRVSEARWRRCVAGVQVHHAPEPSPGDRCLHHGHGDRGARELRHRVHRDRWWSWRVDHGAWLEIYQLAFAGRQVGLASALAVVLFILVLVCVLPIQRLARGDET